MCPVYGVLNVYVDDHLSAAPDAPLLTADAIAVISSTVPSVRTTLSPTPANAVAPEDAV